VFDRQDATEIIKVIIYIQIFVYMHMTKPYDRAKSSGTQLLIKPLDYRENCPILLIQRASICDLARLCVKLWSIPKL
jgi:hypothetical protein